DTFPAAMHVAEVERVKNALIRAIKSVHDAIAAKAKEFKDVVKIGRTHLQDAVPLTFGQEFGGWASLLERDIKRLEQVLDGLYDLAIGGTAVGTGLNAHPEFAERAAKKIAELTRLPFRSHGNKFAALTVNFELNVFKPVMIYNFLHAVTLISDACHGYIEYMIKGIEVDRAKVDWYVKNSLMLVTALTPKIGYDKAAKVAHTAHVE